MQKKDWVHCDIERDKFLIHNDKPVLADFRLTVKQGTTASVVDGKLEWPAVYPPYSTDALYKAPVYVNRDWLAFTVVLYEMYLNNSHTPYPPPESWWQPEVVALMDQNHSSGASGLFGAPTMLSLYMSPEASSIVPAAAAAGSKKHRLTTNTDRQDSSHSLDAMWDSYVNNGGRCPDAAKKCENHNKDRFKPYLQQPVRRTCRGSPRSCRRWRQGNGKVQGHTAPTRTTTTDKSPFRYIAADGEAGLDPRGHLWVTWGVYLCSGKPPLADIILSHPPDLTRCDSVIGSAIPAMSGHIQY